MSARARWAVPAGAVAAIGIVIGATAVASAAQPSLPARSVAQLLADVQQGVSRPLGPLTATVQETANLGLPALPQIAEITGQTGPLSALAPLAGTTSLTVWYLDQQHVRVAEPVQMGENDLRLNGRQLWLWDSKSQTATHVLLPAQAGTGQSPAATWSASSSVVQSAAPNQSPLAAAQQALAAIGPSTAVTLGPNVTVAGRPAYQISIAPKGTGSLVSQILIAIDATRDIPLQVQVIARGSANPAFQIGFTALTFGRPALSNFTFTPPAGAKVKTVTVPANAPAGLSKLGPAGLSSLGVSGLAPLGVGGPGVSVGTPCPVRLAQNCDMAPAFGRAQLPKAVLQQLRAQFIAHLPKNLTAAQRAAAIKGFDTKIALRGQGPPGWSGFAPYAGPAGMPKAVLQQLRAQFIAGLPKNLTAAQRAAAISAVDRKLAAIQANPNNGGGFVNTPTPGPGGSGAPTVLGKDWTTVVATPASPAVAAAVQQLLSGKPVSGPVGTGSLQSCPPVSCQPLTPAPAGVSAQISSTQVGAAPVGPYLDVLRVLLKASTPVHGSWGSGRLLRTALLSVLITSKGQILAGAVTPSVLSADAATLTR